MKGEPKLEEYRHGTRHGRFAFSLPTLCIPRLGRISACAGTIDDIEPQEGEEIDVLPNAEDDQTPLGTVPKYIERVTMVALGCFSTAQSGRNPPAR